MRTSTQYTKELKQQFGYFATWLPSTPLSLGDIGIIRKNVFTKISKLSEFNISFEIEKDNTKADIEHSSKGAVSISTKASGIVAPHGSSLGEIDAGITVNFSKENAVFFKANGTTSPSIKDQIKLGLEIIKLFKKGKWNKNWVVITELVNAKSATILISSSSIGKIELKAKGEAKIQKLDIANANIGFELMYSRDLSTKIIAEEALTPLFKASKLQSRLFLPPVFKMKRVQSIDLLTPFEAKKDEEVIYFDEVKFENEED